MAERGGRGSLNFAGVAAESCWLRGLRTGLNRANLQVAGGTYRRKVRIHRLGTMKREGSFRGIVQRAATFRVVNT